jgi:hypothetical protein
VEEGTDMVSRSVFRNSPRREKPSSAAFLQFATFLSQAVVVACGLIVGFGALVLVLR